MKREIVLNQHPITYELRKHKRARTVRISVYPGGRCVVTVPWWHGEKSAKRFLQEKAIWLLKNLKTMRVYTDERLLGYSNTQEYQQKKDEARLFIEDKVQTLNSMYGFTYRSLSIRNQKTRWGSCSSKGHLSFNYKLILIPEYLAEYVIVHELCHLKELNHSKEFWALVSRAFPRYKEARKELRKY